MIDLLILFVLSIAFFVLGLFVSFGKGNILIIGYNSMPEEEKEKYNIKKIGRVIGPIIIITSVLLFVFAIISCLIDAGTLSLKVKAPFLIVLLVLIVGGLIFSLNFINKQKK